MCQLSEGAALRGGAARVQRVRGVLRQGNTLRGSASAADARDLRAHFPSGPLTPVQAGTGGIDRAGGGFPLASTPLTFRVSSVGHPPPLDAERCQVAIVPQGVVYES